MRFAKALEVQAVEPHLAAYDVAAWLAQRAPRKDLPSAHQYAALVKEAALGYFDTLDLARRFNIRGDVLDALNASSGFQADVLEERRKQDEGLSASRINARKVIRKALDKLDDILDDEDVPACTKLKAIKELREVAGLSAGPAQHEEKGPAVALQIVTNLGVAKQTTGTYHIETIPFGDLLE